MPNCNLSESCLNNPGSCFKCFDMNFYKVPEDKVRAARNKKARTMQQKSGEESWRYKERLTAARISAMPSAVEMESRVNPGSGNQMHRPGDTLDDVLHMEVKDRKPHFTARGEKQITVKLTWLKDAIEEVRGLGKFPAVCFTTTGDDELYALMNFNDLASLAQEIKYLRWELAKARSGSA